MEIHPFQQPSGLARARREITHRGFLSFPRERRILQSTGNCNPFYQWGKQKKKKTLEISL